MTANTSVFSKFAMACLLVQGSFLTAANISEVVTDKAPLAVGPFSQGVRAGSFLFVSGFTAYDPVTEKLVGDTIDVQTKQVLHYLEEVLKSQGLTFKNVVKVQIFLKNMDDYEVMNNLYAEKFSNAVRPARETIQVSKLPLDALVEITCIAYFPE